MYKLKRITPLIFAIMLLFTSVTVLFGCSSMDLALIKSEWTDVVIDREKEIDSISLNYCGSSAEADVIKKQESIDKILDMCSGLKTEALSLKKPDISDADWSDNNILIYLTDPSRQENFISLRFSNDSEFVEIMLKMNEKTVTAYSENSFGDEAKFKNVALEEAFKNNWDSIIVNREQEIKEAKYKFSTDSSYLSNVEEIRYIDIIIDALRTLDKNDFSSDVPPELSENLDKWCVNTSARFEFYFADGLVTVLNIDNDGFVRVCFETGEESQSFYTKSDITISTLIDNINDFDYRYAEKIGVEEFKEYWDKIIVNRECKVEKIKYHSKFQIYSDSDIKDAERIDNILNFLNSLDENTLTTEAPAEIADNLDGWTRYLTTCYTVYLYEHNLYRYRITVNMDETGIMRISLSACSENKHNVFYARKSAAD